MNKSENLDLTNLAAKDLKHLEKALGVSSIYISFYNQNINSDNNVIKKCYKKELKIFQYVI